MFGQMFRQFQFGAAARNAVLVLGCGYGLSPAPNVHAATGMRGLDTPAIAVKNPSAVLLIAIAHAGSRLVAVGEHGVIIYSDDNGRSWVQGKVPVDVTLTALAFADAKNGWAVGHEGVILHSIDGGRTWQEQLNGVQLNQITLATAHEAVAANDPSPGTARALLRAAHFLTMGPVNPFLAVTAFDQKNVIVFGSYRMVMRSADGGAHWVDWDLHVDDPVSHNIYDATRMGKNIYLAGEAGLVFRSTNDGMTFPAVTSPGDATLFGILPTGDGGIFVYGVAGAAYRSGDDGESWTPVRVSSQSNLTAQTTLSSGAIILGNESGDLFISRDHVRNFKELPAVQPLEIFGLTQAGNGDVVAVGSNGVVVIPGAQFN